MAGGYRIRDAVREDMTAIEALLPMLASFDVPTHREPEQLWHSDRALLRRWIEGEEPQTHVHVAVDGDEVLGLTIITLRPELLSYEPSAHLEVIVVSERARGTGVGRALLENAEREALRRGARSMSLHVFAKNELARRFYARCGYDGELMRYIKTLRED